MAGSKQEQIQAANRICKTLDISLSQLMDLLDRYNERVAEINKETVSYATTFLLPKAVEVDGKITYNLNDDDRAILSGYKKKGEDKLAEEFPELQKVWGDLKHFEGFIDIDSYL